MLETNYLRKLSRTSLLPSELITNSKLSLLIHGDMGRLIVLLDNLEALSISRAG
jgi:hypothetical protein